MATKAQREAEALRKLTQERRDIQAQINEGLRDQNNLTNQYATLLQTQFSKTKEVNNNIKDRVGVLNALVKSGDKSQTIESRIADLQSKQKDIIKEKARINDRSERFKRGERVRERNKLRVDEKALDTELSKLGVQKSFNDGLSEADNLLGGLGANIVKLVKNPLAAAVALLLTFNATQESIGKQFGAIGVTEFRSDLAGANTQFTKLGLGAGEAQSTISNLANDFGVSVSESAKLSENVSRLAISTGTSLDDTTKLIGLFTQTQNLTGEQAANLLASTTALANANNVAPDRVLADVAQSSEFFAQFANEGGENILRAAVQARKLGINLQSVEKITSGLLDFQSSLNAENEASVLIGRRLNFQKARELALSNDVEGATRALVEQLGSAEEFNRLNAIQRKALADAAGVEVGELAKIVNKEKEALTLAGALSKQQIQPIPEEVLTQTAQLIGSLQSLGIVLAENLGPPLNFVVGVLTSAVKIIGFLTSGLTNLVGPIGTTAIALGLLGRKLLLTAIKGVYAGVALLPPPFNIIAGGALAAGLITQIYSSIAGAPRFQSIQGTADVANVKSGIAIADANESIVDSNALSTAINSFNAIEKQTETLNRMLATLDGAFGDGGRGLSKMLAAGVVSGNEQSA